ncbi:hypothetical protein MMPV_002844 [Pyropia vietnamensis]
MAGASAVGLSLTPPPFQGFHPRGGRDKSAAPGGAAVVLPVQSFVIANDEAVFARGACTVYDAVSGSEVAHWDRSREHSLQSFTLVAKRGTPTAGGGEGGRWRAPLVRVAEASNRSSPVSAFFRGFFNPLNKYDILNEGLFPGLPAGTLLARITEVYGGGPVGEAKVVDSCVGSPRLEVQATAALGAAYAVTTTGVTVPWGEVTTRVAARFLPPGNERYSLTVRECTYEEAVVVLAVVMAMDMKRRKTTANRWR